MLVMAAWKSITETLCSLTLRDTAHPTLRGRNGVKVQQIQCVLMCKKSSFLYNVMYKRFFSFEKRSGGMHDVREAVERGRVEEEGEGGRGGEGRGLWGLVSSQ